MGTTPEERAQAAHLLDLREAEIYDENRNFWAELVGPLPIPRLQAIREILESRIKEVTAWPQPGRILFELEVLYRWILIEIAEELKEAEK